MSDYRDYILQYRHLMAGSIPMLEVALDTHEFGRMTSRRLASTEDPKINQHLLHSLADEVIDAYEKKLATRAKVYQGVDLG